MDSLARGYFLLPDGWGLVGLAFHGLTPHGNRYCRACGASRWNWRPCQAGQGCAVNGANVSQRMDLRGGTGYLCSSTEQNGGWRDSYKSDAGTVTARRLMPEEGGVIK